MSSRQRKRPGEGCDSCPPRKQSRLLPSKADGTWQTEPTDCEESCSPALEPGEEVLDLTGHSPEPEVITINDEESPVQSQQQPHLSRASDNSAEPLARNDEEEAREDDGAQPADPACPLSREDEDSEERDREQSQLYPLDSSETEDSAELWPSDNEEEPRDNDDSINSDEWPDRFESPPTWRDDITDDWEGSQQYPLDSGSAENSNQVLASNLQQEPRDIEFEPPGGLVSPPNWEDDNAEFPEVHGQEGRSVAVNSQEQVDGSGDGSGGNDAPVAVAAPVEQASAEDTERSAAEPGIVIKCPICMDFYSEIVQSGRELVSTLCGHLFCSTCLPRALETAQMCPICRAELNPGLYHPIYF